MERRKILLGSGAALATALAGCSSSETDEPSGNGSSDDDGSSGSGGNGSSDSGSNSGSDSDSDSDDIPGFDKDGFELSSDELTVMEIDRSGDTVDVLVSTQVTETEKLNAEIEAVAGDIVDAITDPDVFKDEIDTVEWVLEQDGNRVLGLFVDVEWVLKFIEDEISRDELVNKMLDSAN